VICPNCDKSCEDGATFCPHCEAVLDASFLGDLPSDAEGEDTPVPEARAPKPASRQPARQPARSPKPAAARPRRRAPIDEEPRESTGAAEPEPSASSSGVGNKYSQYWVDDEPPKPKAAAAAQSRASGPTRPESAEGAFKTDTQDPGVIVKEAWTAFLALHFEDKMTVIASAALFFGSLMPWRTTTDGDDMGFLTWGFLTLLLSIGAIAAVWARKTGKLPMLPARRMPMLSVAAGVVASIIASIFALTSFESGAQYGQVVSVSQPAAGVFFSILASAGVIVGGILTGKREG
jgi:hypothetical protein